MARNMRPAKRRKRSSKLDWTSAMPIGRQNPCTPMGQIEQFGKFASGVNRATGRHRIAGRLLALVILLPVLAGIIILIARHV